MVNKEEIAELRKGLERIREESAAFFAEAQHCQDEGDEYSDIWDDLLTLELREKGEAMRGMVKRISVEIAGAARGSPLIAEADLQDLRHNTRRMLAAIHFHEYRYWGVHVHHDDELVKVKKVSNGNSESIGGTVIAVPTWEHLRQLVNACEATLLICSPWISPIGVTKMEAFIAENPRVRTVEIWTRLTEVATDSRGLLRLARTCVSSFGSNQDREDNNTDPSACD